MAPVRVPTARIATTPRRLRRSRRRRPRRLRRTRRRRCPRRRPALRRPRRRPVPPRLRRKSPRKNRPSSDNRTVLPPDSAPPPPPTDTAEYPIYDEPVIRDGQRVSAASVASIDVFYDQLDPYGTWYDDPTYGWAFTPSQAGLHPVHERPLEVHGRRPRVGHNDPFGWATAHYGRWVYQNGWVWVPDTTWGPAWVRWRQGDGWIGWAPAASPPTTTFPTTTGGSSRRPDLFSIDLNRRVVSGNIRVYLDAACRSPLSPPRRRLPGPPARARTGSPQSGYAHARPRQARHEVGRFDAQRRAEPSVVRRGAQHEWDRAARVRTRSARSSTARERAGRGAEAPRRDPAKKIADEQRRQDKERPADRERAAARSASSRRAKPMTAERTRLEDEQTRLADGEAPGRSAPHQQELDLEAPARTSSASATTPRRPPEGEQERIA